MSDGLVKCRCGIVAAMGTVSESRRIRSGRAAITRWTDAHIPRDYVMVACGHKQCDVHGGYVQFTDEELLPWLWRGLMSEVDGLGVLI